MSYYMKQPCKHCPFRRSVKPFLTAERGQELAYHAVNPYNSFTSHKTTVYNENGDDGEMVATEDSLECAGFMILQANISGRGLPQDVNGMGDVYEDTWEMCDAYDESNER